jgi:hypothetical protein
MNIRRNLHDDNVGDRDSYDEVNFSLMTTMKTPTTMTTTTTINTIDNHSNDSNIIIIWTPSSASDIEVKYGCLLIPVFLAAWWYYTTRTCRTFVRGFIGHTPCHDHDDSNDDTIRNNHVNSHDDDYNISGHFARMEEAYWYVCLFICLFVH